MAEHLRYRIEGGEPVIDVKVAAVDSLFDNRDPAPFRARDLDPTLVEYLVDSSEDLLPAPKFRVVFWLETPCPPKLVEEAVRAHFGDELERVDRRRRRQRRIGLIMLAFATVAIVALVSLAQLVTTVLHGSLGAALKEGLVISAWVFMWKPIEVLVYERIPWLRERKIIARLLAVPVEVRDGRDAAAGAQVASQS